MQQWAVLSVPLLGVLACFYFLDPSRTAYSLPCPFHALTGLHCPGCGTQRALHHILHGRIEAAAGTNLLFVVAAPLAAMWVAAEKWRPKLQKRRAAALIILLIAATAFGIVRNLPLAGCSWLAP